MRSSLASSRSKYIDAEEVARTFRSFMPANSRIIPYEQTNTVIVTDTGSNIAKLNKMLEILDVEGYDAGIEVIPVKYASASELSKLIDTLIPGTGGSPTGGAPGAPLWRGATAAEASALVAPKKAAIINTIIADDRTNTLIVHANSKGADRSASLVIEARPKAPGPSGAAEKFTSFICSSPMPSRSPTRSTASRKARAPRHPSTRRLRAARARVPASIRSPKHLRRQTSRISADKATNALVISASPDRLRNRPPRDSSVWTSRATKSTSKSSSWKSH